MAAFINLYLQRGGQRQLTAVTHNRFYQTGTLAGTSDPSVPTLPLEYVAPAGGDVNATFSVTIENATQSASADVIVSATASQTIAAVTQSASADILINASASQTIDAVTLAATSTLGSSAINATASQQIEPVTLSANADLIISATASQTIDALTLSASADVIVGASAGQTIGVVTQSATAALIIAATASQTIADIALSAGATLSGGAINATFDATIDAVTLDATASIVALDINIFDYHDGSTSKSKSTEEVQQERYRKYQQGIRDTVAKFSNPPKDEPEAVETVAPDKPLPATLTRLLELPDTTALADIASNYDALNAGLDALLDVRQQAQQQQNEDNEIAIMLAMGDL